MSTAEQLMTPPPLVLRLRNQLQRRLPARSGPMRVGLVSIDAATREVSVGGEPVHLANKGVRALAGAGDRAAPGLHKDELLKEICGYQSEARTRTLDSHASRLRHKLDPVGGRYVVN